MALQSPCDFAKARYLELLRLRIIWSYLIVLLGVAVVIFLIISILFFIRTNWLPAALGTLGTLLSGGAATWLTSQRTLTRDEEQEAFRELVQTCGPAGANIAPAQGHAVNDAAMQAVRQAQWFRNLENAARQSVLNGQIMSNFLAELRH
ncbi:MAG: hypothetical protein JO166_01715 [Deltaproteobacteria bacterium]|nr:hypothetical protein [Deltaproteobacteria bacterium]